VADPYFTIFAFEAFVGAGFLANFLYYHRVTIRRLYRKLCCRAADDDEGLLSKSSSMPSSPSPEVPSVYFKLQSREEAPRLRNSMRGGDDTESNV
jgi:hypothetical protein